MGLLRDVKTGREVVLEAPALTIGRSNECDVRLAEPKISSRHAMVLRTPEGFYLADLGSSNGTRVNDKTVKDSTRLQSGDRIELGGVITFEFHDTQSARMAFSFAEPTMATETALDAREVEEALRPEVSAEAKLRAVLELSRNLGTALNVREVLARVLESLFTLFSQTDRGFVLLRDPPDGPLIPAAVRQRSPDARPPAVSRTIIDHVMQTGRAVLSADAHMDLRFDPSQSIRAHQIRSIMCVPLTGQAGSTLGVIQLDTTDRKGQYRPEDLDVLASSAVMATRAVELARVHEFRRDLEAANQIQKGFLPSSPPQIPGMTFFDYYASAQQVGGDYYDYIPLPGNRLAVAVGDVAGKGVSAALLMARLSAAARFCLATEPNPEAAVRRLNETLMAAGAEGRFITFVVGVIDLATFETTWVNAGHVTPFCRRANGEVEPIGEARADVPLGVFERPYLSTPLSLHPGDAVLLCTDGVIEARNPSGELYGLPRLKAKLAAAPADVKVIGVGVLADVRTFAAGRAPDDDLALVCFGRSN